MRGLTTKQKEQYAVFGTKAAELQQMIEDLCSQVEEFTAEVQEQAQNYFDDRSEKWQEGERGQQYDCWIQSLEFSETTLDDLIEWLERVPATPEEA